MPTKLGIKDRLHKTNFGINAKTAAEIFGESLIGIQVITDPMGCWPGGLCEVISLQDDPNAPEIVFNVKRLEKRTEMMDYHEVDDECGVFEYEDIHINEMDKLLKEAAQRGIAPDTL